LHSRFAARIAECDCAALARERERIRSSAPARVRDYGVLAARHALRPAIVPHPEPAPAPKQLAMFLPSAEHERLTTSPAALGEQCREAAPSSISWARLLARVFAIDVTRCSTTSTTTDPHTCAPRRRTTHTEHRRERESGTYRNLVAWDVARDRSYVGDRWRVPRPRVRVLDARVLVPVERRLRERPGRRDL